MRNRFSIGRRWLVLLLTFGFLQPAVAATLDVVEDAVQAAVAASVEDAVAEQVQSQTAAAVEDQVTSQVVEQTVAGVEEQVADRVADAAAQQVESSVAGAVDDVVSDRVVDQTTTVVLDRVHSAVEGSLGVVDRIAEPVTETAADTLKGGITLAGPAAGAASSGRPFAMALDPAGRPIEAGVLMLLVPRDDVAAVHSLGIPVRRQTAVDGLDAVLMRLEVSPGAALSLAADRVRAASGRIVMDFNHLYDFDSQGVWPADDEVPAAPAGRNDPAADGLVLGVIDTALDQHHPALAGARVQHRDFVSGDWVRPTAHGTAVASILVGSAEAAAGAGAQRAQAGLSLYAAGVFFERAPGQMTATAESIIQAVSWLLEHGVDVVNMSLTGPPNELLRAAIGRAADSGAWVVAAVGNNGPIGEPLYPAAYDGVIGVTAVDADHRIYTYANRGRQVTFAAPGVDVRVARSGGGFGTDQGTSLASAHAAVVIAAARRAADSVGWPAARTLERLKAQAMDLGPEGFDETYGHGLIAPLSVTELAAEQPAEEAPGMGRFPSSGGR
jgi:hypothetical protein